MKKRFALYGMFAAMAIFATACGDDSSSGPDEEESSSSIEAEDESSSSVEEEGKSSAKEEGKSSAEEKDAKSSSSEAKKGDSSSSEEASSSSSIGNPYAGREADPYCNVSLSGDSIILEYGFDEFNQRATFAWNAKKASVVGNGSDCDNIELLSKMLFYEGVLETVNECTVKNLELDEECSFTDMDLFGATTKEDMKNILEKDFCPYMLSNVMPTEYLNPNVKYGNFIDSRNFVVYKMVKIGNQTWMAQNLNYEPSSGSSCYEEDWESCHDYGRLYTWEAAQNACPTGWRLPTKDDFVELVANVDSDFEGIPGPFDNGDKLKTETWGVGSNEIGFSAVPAGRYGDKYDAIGRGAFFWGQTVDVGAIVMVLLDDKSDFEQGNPDDYLQMSVRCIKDDAPAQSISSN